MKILFSIIALLLCLSAQAQTAIPKAAQVAAAKKLEGIDHGQLIVEHYALDEGMTARVSEILKAFKKAKLPADYTHNIRNDKPKGVRIQVAPKVAPAMKEALTDLFKAMEIEPTWQTVTNQSDNEVRIFIGEVDL